MNSNNETQKLEKKNSEQEKKRRVKYEERFSYIMSLISVNLLNFLGTVLVSGQVTHHTVHPLSCSERERERVYALQIERKIFPSILLP